MYIIRNNPHPPKIYPPNLSFTVYNVEHMPPQIYNEDHTPPPPLNIPLRRKCCRTNPPSLGKISTLIRFFGFLQINIRNTSLCLDLLETFQVILGLHINPLQNRRQLHSKGFPLSDSATLNGSIS